MKKLRYGAMAVTIAVGVGAFLLAQRFDIIPGPWSKDRASWISEARFAASREALDDPQDYMDYYRRGVQMAKARQFESALTELDTAVRMRPTPLTLEELGPRANDSSLAETHTFRMVVLLHAARADVLQHMNRPEEALIDLDQALALDHRKVETLYQRGMLRLATGRHQEAVTDFDTMLNIRRSADWFFARGIAKYVQADWSDAGTDFEAAARMAPQEQTYLIWLAKAYLRAGKAIPTDPFAALSQNSDARYVIEAFMSDHDPIQFMAGMRAGAAYVDRRRLSIQCETALFAGEWLLVRKKGAGARNMFSEAVSSCQPFSVEHTIAAAELQRLKP